MNQGEPPPPGLIPFSEIEDFLGLLTYSNSFICPYIFLHFYGKLHDPSDHPLELSSSKLGSERRLRLIDASI
jgi:hypothetical protein